jgi:hypothetical protein
MKISTTTRVGKVKNSPQLVEDKLHRCQLLANKGCGKLPNLVPAALVILVHEETLKISYNHSKHVFKAKVKHLKREFKVKFITENLRLPSQQNTETNVIS